MIRILLDELGSGHNDLILKIDAMPEFAAMADLYYIGDFLCLDPNKIHDMPQDLGLAYISYVMEKFDKVNDAGSFIAFDLSDEYIAGLLISSGKKGLIKVSYMMTDGIHGYQANRQLIDEMIATRKPVFKKERDWLIGKDAIMKGLDWSAKRIERNK